MELKKIISMIGGKILYGTEEILRREYSYAVASDLMSNVMPVSYTHLHSVRGYVDHTGRR